MKIKYATNEIRLHRKCLALKIIDENWEALHAIKLSKPFPAYHTQRKEDFKTIVESYYRKFKININKNEFDSFVQLLEEYGEKYITE